MSKKNFQLAKKNQKFSAVCITRRNCVREKVIKGLP